MKKITRKSLIMIITIAVLFVVLGTATFAWITINNMASVRGMRMEVDTTNALQIEEEVEIVEENFTNKVDVRQTNQVKYLQPVSSADGISFFYTPNLLSGIDGLGQLNDDAQVLEYDSEAFAALYSDVYPGKTIQGYAEYTFILKAYASTDNVSIYLNKLEFNSAASDVNNKTFRVAVLVKEYDPNTKFADLDYVSKGIISSREVSGQNSLGRSIKNFQEMLAFGKITAGDVKTGENTTIKQYVTNYGNVLYSDDNGTTYYKDASKTAGNTYTLITSGDDQRIELGNEVKLHVAEYVSGVSFTQEHGKYKFTTNKGKVVYGSDPEAVNNASFDEYNYLAYAFTAAQAAPTENSTTEFVVGSGADAVTYYEFTTGGEKVYGKSATADNNNEYYYKANPDDTDFVKGLRAYTMDTTTETIDGDGVPVKLLNGNTYYKFVTSENRTLYCASSDYTKAPLFTGQQVAESANYNETRLDKVVEFDATKSLLDITAGNTGYVLVTFRIWVEGEDQDCNNAKYVTLGKDYSIDADFSLSQPTGNIYLIK